MTSKPVKWCKVKTVTKNSKWRRRRRRQQITITWTEGVQCTIYTGAWLTYRTRSFEPGVGCSTLMTGRAVSLKADMIVAVTAIVGNWFQNTDTSGVEWELVSIYCWSRDGALELMVLLKVAGWKYDGIQILTRLWWILKNMVFCATSRRVWRESHPILLMSGVTRTSCGNQQKRILQLLAELSLVGPSWNHGCCIGVQRHILSEVAPTTCG